MVITKTQLQSIITGTQEERVESLCKLLDYPINQKDPQGSRFWYLRPANDEDDAEDTCPIAVSFYPELNDFSSDNEVKHFFSSDEQDTIIRGHYIQSTAENQPVMYLLFPSTDNGRIAFILPTESRLRQRSIQSFTYNDQDLLARLGRLQWAELADKVLEKALNLIPQVDWIFYKPAVTAKELAEELAIVTQRIEQVIPSVYHSEGEDGYLHKLLKSFQKELLPNLKLNSDDEKEYSFADIYAQTIAYGLFTARVFSYVKNPNSHFYREGAWDKLPETNPFLRQLFKDISERSPLELGDELVDAIAEAFAILRAAKMDAILADFRNKMNREDIVIRFYEDFLKAYKPRMREKRGVYYTPEPVVSYMVRSVDELIKDKFNKPLGIADSEVMILDPACGTGTFLLWIFQLIYQRFQENPEALTKGLSDKSWTGYVTERLLPRIFGFELLVAPYSICHLKLGLFLEETGYQFNSGKRLGVYLINTLEDIELREEKAQFTLNIPQIEELIAEEAKAGSKIKKQEPIMVIIGNPPYSGHSENNNDWIKGLLNDYYFIDGKPLGEKNPKWLQDDYVKFIRFSQWRIDKSGQGILAFINNHGFLDNPTFRGMRQQLINSFDGISIYDLHGNSKKKETALDGSKDENVFDIQQGVSINLAVKSVDKYINHAHLYGLRENKYKILSENTINSTDFKEVNPQSEFYLFIPQDTDLFGEYEPYLKITDIMPVNNTGIISKRDSLAFQSNKESVRKVVTDIFNLSEAEIVKKYPLSSWNSRDGKVEYVKKSVMQYGIDEFRFIEILYRPFDKRWTYYTPKSKGFIAWPVYEVMKNMLLGNNLGLVSCRQQSEKKIWNLCSVTNTIIESCAVSNKTKEIGSLFPLYLYPDTDKPKELQQEKRANFSQEFLDKIESKLGYLPTPEAIFYYIYAVFHSPTYRSRYAEFLKIDFPRVPLTSNNQLFTELSALGEELVQLHLMTSPKLDKLITTFIDKGDRAAPLRDRTVASGYPKYIDGVVMINKKEGFEGISEEVWNFYIGGYQVCHKWLKDRKGRILSDDDILHYQKIVIALSETIKLMALIDETIPSFPIE